MSRKATRQTEYGDYQTPPELASAVCRQLHKAGMRPRSIVEPNAGTGSFLVAALETFETVERAYALEINAKYVDALRKTIHSTARDVGVEVVRGDFFALDWPTVLAQLPDPILVIGNPPWITSADLARIGGKNAPRKSNFVKLVGLDAKTGKSNFDISEWMLIREVEYLSVRHGTLAMLCKMAVARKVLAYAWRLGLATGPAHIYMVNAQKYFGALVDACLLTIGFRPDAPPTLDCPVHSELGHDTVQYHFGLRDRRVVADVDAYARWRHLAGSEGLRWRSGIKHDCKPVMELILGPDGCHNGLGNTVELESTYLYPMVTGGDLDKGRSSDDITRWMLVPQTAIGEDTGAIRERAPKTWQYLLANAARLDRRKSSIYRGRPRFSIFGVGDYSFSPWKVAISGFHKRLRFRVIGPSRGRPVVLDDTSYFLPFVTEEAALLVARILNSEPVRQFYDSQVYWQAKRPITRELLATLDLVAAAKELGLEIESVIVATQRVGNAN